ncbi:MAG TPA: hypothetical protein PKB10_06800, partial [Tepidisphaeraceae bacterium]|nr:hypothetical protein [Tepidisphaeraceae bacterium]
MKGKFRLTVGDPSASHSERWALQVGRPTHVAPSFGEVGSGDYFYQPGKTYDIRLRHLGSNINPPDYDWTASITPTPGLPALPHFFIDDEPKILGFWGPGATNTVSGKVSKFVIPLLDLDIDSDNNGGFAPPTDNRE